MKRTYLALVLSIYFLVGCAAAKPMYYWEDYSSSLYNLKKTSNETNLLAHKQVLEKIVEQSSHHNVRVPPGVFCEYGFIMMKEGNNKEALKYFDLEEKTYPESKILVEKLKAVVH